jgi:hypothetical protein
METPSTSAPASANMLFVVNIFCLLAVRPHLMLPLFGKGQGRIFVPKLTNM